MKLKDLVARLDPNEDSHWTDDGLPSLTQFEKGTTREAITRFAPELTRTSAAIANEPEPEPEPEVDPEPEPEPEVDLLSAAQDARDKAVQAATDAGMARDRAEQALRDAQVAAAEAQRLVEIHTPVEHNQTAIQRYLESQNSIRAARADRMTAVRKAGISVTDLTGKSQLDLAMSRKDTRGAQRPARHTA